MKVVIASRMSSSRLPGKALRPIFDHLTMLDVLVHRINMANSVTGIILATSNDESDDALDEWARRNGISCYRGSLDDVLGRLVGCLREFKLKDFVEILGDNPLVDPSDIDRCVNAYEKGEYDYVATSTTEYEYAEPTQSYPVGVRVQCLRSKLIYTASQNLLDAHSREHSSSFIYGRNHGYKIKLLHYPHDLIDGAYRLNLAVNTSVDFSRTVKTLEKCGLDAPLNTILEYLVNPNSKV